MTRLPLWDRLRRARVVQILLVYLGASWIVLQIIETLMGLLTLPPWVGPVALVLLLVGLFVVLATAWVQSLPQTTAREEAGEVPTDWQVAPGDILASVRAGRLPHLTWGRALLGGVFALSLLFGAAGVYVILRGPRRPLGPAEVGRRVRPAGSRCSPSTSPGRASTSTARGWWTSCPPTSTACRATVPWIREPCWPAGTVTSVKAARRSSTMR